jgi:hypothetical protein
LEQLHNKNILVAAGIKIPLRSMRISPHKVPPRIVVYAKDVENMTGRKTRAAQHLLKQIREKFGKGKEQFVTVREFSLYTGIDEDLVREFLTD